MWKIHFLWIWILIQSHFHPAIGLSPLWDSVTTNIHQEYDVQEGHEVLTVRMNMGEYKSTDLVVGEDIRPDSRLILTCVAHHGPAEWVYSGDGTPDYITNMTIENLSLNGEVLPIADMSGAKRYVATLTLGRRRMTTKDTGRYNCLTASPETGLQYKTLSAFYHLYVPARSKLFIREPDTVYYDLTRSAARIPCGVTNPKTSVTLQKLVKGNLEFLPNGENMLYHPISGFYPKKDIPGVYACTAAFNNTFDFVYFKLTPSSSSETTYHNNVKYNYNTRKTSKKPPKITKPEDLEWLIYSTPTKFQDSIPTTKRPRTTTEPTLNSSQLTNRTPYVPFHIRYSTTTYGPFHTFYDVHANTTLSPYHKHKQTVKTRPFNPFEYPPEIYSDIPGKPTRRPTSSQGTKPYKIKTNSSAFHSHSPIPEHLISYRPVFNYFKDTSRPNSTSNQRPKRPTVSSSDTWSDRSTTTSPTRRTTPRKYRPQIIQTTEMPVTIPEMVICSQFSCGVNAVCFVSTVYYETLNATKDEPACKCLTKHIGNPYLNCYLPAVLTDPNVLYFNASFRSPVLADPIYAESEGEDDSAENQIYRGNTTAVDIIDM